MKKITLLLLALFSIIYFSGCASSKEATSEQTKHEYIKDFSDIKKEDLFDRSMKWITQNFRSGKQVIDYQDKTAGTIIAKGIILDVNFGNILNGNLGFTLTIDMKDNRAKFSFTNVMPINPSDGQEVTGISQTERVHIAAKKEFDKLVNDITKAMSTKSDW